MQQVVLSTTQGEAVCPFASPDWIYLPATGTLRLNPGRSLRRPVVALRFDASRSDSDFAAATAGPDPLCESLGRTLGRVSCGRAGGQAGAKQGGAVAGGGTAWLGPGAPALGGEVLRATIRSDAAVAAAGAFFEVAPSAHGFSVPALPLGTLPAPSAHWATGPFEGNTTFLRAGIKDGWFPQVHPPM